MKNVLRALIIAMIVLGLAMIAGGLVMVPAVTSEPEPAPTTPAPTGPRGE